MAEIGLRKAVADDCVVENASPVSFPALITFGGLFLGVTLDASTSDPGAAALASASRVFPNILRWIDFSTGSLQRGGGGGGTVLGAGLPIGLPTLALLVGAANTGTTH